MRSTARRKTVQRARRFTAITAVVSLIAGALALGVTAQMATADPWAPAVTAQNVDPSGAGKDFVLAGEDVEFEVAVSNRDGGPQFNLSLVATLPASVTFASGGVFGAPTIFAAGDVLPNRARTAGEDCVDVGLVDSATPPLCAVPDGQQVWVWSNVNDLPQGATVSSTISVTPQSDEYPVGSRVGFSIRAYTSTDPARIPTFDGSASVSRTVAHTSGAGTATDDVPVQALRIVKDEPSDESELLRGAHRNVTTYTLAVENTSRGATTGVTVTDYLPAGLEYLGLGAADNSAGVEYTDSDPLSGGATVGETVETVRVSASEAVALGLPGAGVYTKVTWTIGTLDAEGGAEIRYRAAVPLLANDVWADGTAPTPESGAQAANLDNNTGASTRHGGETDPESAQVFRNVATVAGTYQGPVLGDDDELRAARDDDSEDIEAVDVRVLKRVENQNPFATGRVATYGVQIDVSEYVDARDIVLTDVIPNGLCPAFPTSPSGVALMIGDLEVSQEAWNQQVPGDACNFPTTAPGAVLSPELSVVSIRYAPADGTFTVRFAVQDLPAESSFTAQYSAMQRPNYTGASGGTSAGDSFRNTVQVTAVTEPIAAIAADPDLLDRVGGTRVVTDDSAAMIGSGESVLSKTVLERGQSPDDADAEWVSAATHAFSPGDDVWYRIAVDFATGIDSRNAVLTDYLPEGVAVSEVRYAYTGIPAFDDVTAPVAYGDGTFPTDYIPNAPISGTPLTWAFGAHNRSGSDDRFMPAGSTVTVYVRGEVQAQSASREEVDNPLNQAKFQQSNVDGEIFFLRDDAGIDLDWGSTLVKGIQSVNGTDVGDGFGAGAKTAQVVQKDEVAYRIDVTAPQNSTTDYVVWDVLPAGVRAADVGSFSTQLYDDGDVVDVDDADVDVAAYDVGDTLPAGIAPATPAFDGRSVIAWTIRASVAGSTPAAPGVTEVVRGLTLGYTLTVPYGAPGGGAAAQPTQIYTNTAGIVSYAIENAGGGTTTVVPQGEDGRQQLTDRTPQIGEVPVSDVDTVDRAEVRLPDVRIEKSLLSTEIAPTADASTGVVDLGDADRNGVGQIVQGEYATFEYVATIPAGTTVRGAVLSDDGAFTGASGNRVDYEYVAGSARYLDPSGDPLVIGTGSADFRAVDTAGSSHGVLTFPDSYTNATDEDQTFRVRITVWVKDAGGLANATALTNRATLRLLDPNATDGSQLTRTDTADVQFVDPLPTLEKRASTEIVGADGRVTYTLTAANTTGRPALYDVVVLDCVPGEITPDADTLTWSAGSATILGDRCAISSDEVITPGSGTGTLIEWRIPALRGTGDAVTLTYTGTVEAAAGGGSSFTNHAELTGRTLPTVVGSDTDTSDRRGVRADDADATVRLPEASIAKTVTATAAPVGDVVTYTVTTTLPENTNFYDLVLTDTLPAGVRFLADGAHSETVDWAGAPGAPSIGAPSADDDVLTWSVGPNDVAAWDEPRTITVTYQARLTPDAVSAAPTNRASFVWSKIDGSTAEGDRRTVTAEEDVTLLNPRVTVAKSVKPTAAADSAYAASASGDPNASFTYRVKVTNQSGGGSSPAYGIVVTDDVDAGVRIDTSQAAFAGATFRPDAAALEAGRGGTITWTLAGPLSNLAGANEVDLVYRGTFVDAAALRTGPLDNDVAVTRYESATTGGWVYQPGTGTVPGGAPIPASTATASVNPLFPQIALQKRVTAGTEAFVGESFSWTLQARNMGTGSAQTITLTDTLPANWEFDSAVTPRVSIGGGAYTDLAAPVVSTQAGSQTLTWTLGSATGQRLLPGTVGGASATQRTVLVTFSAKPLAGALTDPGAGLTIDHLNRVSGSATDTTGETRNATGSYTGAEARAVAHIARADLKIVKAAVGGDAQGAWTAGDTARAGYTQPQWRITITNQGPDAASGPFLVTDTTDLPAGVTTGVFTARYHSGAADALGTPVALAGTGTAADPFRVGAATQTLRANGTDRIVLTADVSIQAPATGTATNTADVTGRTFERPADITKDNTSSASKSISSAADLVVEKSVNTAEVTAGRPITWSIKVRNAGPSVAVSSGAEPITVTDTIPDGILDVQQPTGLTAWTVTASDGWPASAGDTITWTFSGAQLPVGPAQDLSLTGTVASSWTGGDIRNVAVATPGATTDPDLENNEGEVTVTPDDGTTLAITKTRVVLDGGVWKDAAQLGRALDDVVAGESVSYRVIVTNNGPADAREVRVVDEVPDMLSYASVQDENGTWTRTAGPGRNDTFSLAGTVSPAAGANTRSFVVTYTVDSALAPGSAVENWVSASAANTDPDTPVRDGDTTASDRVADLSVVKQALDADGVPVAADVVAEVTAGTLTRFRLTVANNGPSASSAPIVVSDRLPAGMTYVSSTIDVASSGATAADATVSTDGRSIDWDVLAEGGTLAAGATVVIEVTAAVSPEVLPQRLVNTADVRGPEDFDPSNNHDEVSVDIVTLAELTVVKSVEDGPWLAGTDVEYTITVDNAGPSVADAFVSDLLPAGLTAVSIAGAGWTCDDATQSCLRVAHPLGESTITVVAHVGSGVPTGTSLVNTATLTWTDSRSTSPHEDVDTAEIDVTTDADLALRKSAVDATGAETGTAVAGESARYRIEVDNDGPSDAVGPVVVVDTLPAGIRFAALVGESAEAWTADADDADPQVVTFTLRPEDAGLANGSAAPMIEFDATVDAAIAHGTLLTNTATVSSGTPDANPLDDSDTADLTIVREVDLSITKTHDPDAVRIGDELPFAIEVRNAGPSEATGVVVTDVVPAGLEVLSAVGDDVGDDWTLLAVEPVDVDDEAAGTRVVARFDPVLAPGESTQPLTVRTRVLVSAYSEVVNTAEATATEITPEHPDRTPSDNRAEDRVVVPAMSALVVEKTAVGAFQVGKTGEYRIVVRNDGPTADPGPITVVDALPEGLTFASSPDAGVRVDGRTVTWTLEDGLALDEEITLTLRVGVGQAAYPSVTNAVVVSSPSEQTDDAQTVSAATADVRAADPLATTGGQLAWGLLAMAVLLILSGGFFAAHRRRMARTA